MTRYEYRVSWTREGRARKTQIMQTEQGAREKAKRMVEIDEELDPDRTGSTEGATYDDFDGTREHPLAGMPKLTAPPALERREVGAWEEIE